MIPLPSSAACSVRTASASGKKKLRHVLNLGCRRGERVRVKAPARLGEERLVPARELLLARLPREIQGEAQRSVKLRRRVLAGGLRQAPEPPPFSGNHREESRIVRARRCHQAKVYSATWPKTPCGKGFVGSDGLDVGARSWASPCTLRHPRAFYTRAVQRRGAQTILILALALLPALAALHSRSFFSPDETSYAQVAREMLETRDFVVPTIDGAPWLEKPPLVYWLLAGAFAIFGWGFPAAVLLNTLLTAVTALVIAAHARRFGSPRAGLLAATAYLTMFLPLAAARSALTDPVLTLCTTAAIVLFLSARRFAVAGAGVLLGLGVLAKGPVAPLVVLPAMLAVAVVRRRGADWGRLGTVLVAAVAVALPWHLALASRGLWHEFSAVFLGRQVLSRAVSAWGIGAPWWFYVPALLLAAFPWGTHLVLAVRDQWRRLAGSSWRDAAPVAEVAAVVVPLLAFSIATNKLPHYLLPLIPWLAVWLGLAAERRLSESRADRFTRVTVCVAAVINTGALAALAWQLPDWQVAHFTPPATSSVLACAAVLFAVLGLVEGIGVRRAAWCGLAALALLLRLALDQSLLPFADRQTVERPLAAAVRQHLPPNGVPIAYRWWRASFVAYGVRGWTRTESRDDWAPRLPPRRGRDDLRWCWCAPTARARRARQPGTRAGPRARWRASRVSARSTERSSRGSSSS